MNRAVTLAETIRLTLADDITAGRLAPGSVIDESQLAIRFGASRTPAREALRELAAAGLVEIEPRRGARVARITTEQLAELFELMAETEAMCARLATYRMTAMERFGLQSLHAGFNPADSALDAYDEYNRGFHNLLYRGTHNGVLAEHAATLRLRLAPYRRAQFNEDRRIERSFAEHEAILEQVLRGAGEEAAQLMRVHILTASAALAQYMRRART
ncbi:GntR family transcriptional regulator [Teichococcus oryzae]|uniref:GntR family transcriptional regulator n=1 Tax=Teichococcus oryzae TaxID=1608942 RepID=A0A5B2TFW2_9PROT|nr:GntR family transcriptional regulator [Pseudoroseomonas oryzae]KAA2212690.1 GntR family transcriptional regulator [Pseudoroseomonas oryzae]